MRERDRKKRVENEKKLWHTQDVVKGVSFEIWKIFLIATDTDDDDDAVVLT